MLNYEFPPIGGGSGNATRYMLREFARAGDLDVEVVTSSDDEFRIEQFAARIRVHRLPVGKKELHHWAPLELLRYSWRAYWYTRRLIDRQRFDICHCWSGWPPGVIGHLLRTRTPYIVGLRGSDVPGYNPRLARFDRLVFAPLSRRVWSHARELVANSEDLSALAQRTYSAAMRVIPNGVDAEEFAPGAGMGRALRLLFVGRFVDRKNVPLVLRAMQHLSECTLTLVGEGKRDAKWRELARDLGIADRIRFVGHVAHVNLSPYYKDADVFVLPSDAEGMSNSLLEAMASGLAIVATDTGGASGLVGSAGVIVPAGDDAAFATALQSLVSNRHAVHRMKIEARRRALTRTWRAVADEYRSVYEQAVNASA
jgi:glycosyltransferase involved in cell wall biosynthesis